MTSDGATSVEPPVTMSFTPANSSRTTQRTARSSTKSSTPERPKGKTAAAAVAADGSDDEERDESDEETSSKRQKTLRLNGRTDSRSRPGSRHSSRPSSKLASKYNTPNRGSAREDDETPRTRKRSRSIMEMDVDSPPTRSANRSGHRHSHHHHSHDRHRSQHGTDNEERPTTEKKRPRRDRITRLAQGNPGTGRTSSSKKNAANEGTGSKIKHLKKADGVPLWRRDIQYEFLYAIFTDEQKVFTNSYDGKANQTYADVYIDAMARSSKTSKVLRDKLLTDRSSALNIAMVCLLVNIGRMNTTLNFFPEMRAQLRTYHPIPSLQTYADPNAYKQLQDAPRLKSILKGACEDRKEPADLLSLITLDILPRTNPINLTFLLASFATRVTELHFAPPRDFFDLVMGENLSSKSRARAFLWLQWYYLESNFTAEEAEKNPFGSGLMPDVAKNLADAAEAELKTRMASTAPASDAGDTMDVDKNEGESKDDKKKPSSSTKDDDDEDTKDIKKEKDDESGDEDEKDDDDDDDSKEDKDKEKEASAPPPKPVDDELSRLLKGKPVVVPVFEMLTPEEADKENVDLQPEIDYGNDMQEDRRRKMEAQEAGITPVRPPPKKGKRGKHGDESVDASPAPETLRIPGRHRVFDDEMGTDSDASRAISPDAMDSKRKKLPRINLLHGARDSKGRRKSAGGSSRHSGVPRINLKLTRPPDDIPTPSVRKLAPGEKRPRPPTQYQLAVIENRKARVDHEIMKLVERARRKSRRVRYKEGAFARAWRRIKSLEDPFAKSDDEVDDWEDENSSDESDDGGSRRRSNKTRKERAGVKKHRYNNGTNYPGPAGLVPLSDEEDDYGEETQSYCDAIRRCTRRVERWEIEEINGKIMGNGKDEEGSEEEDDEEEDEEDDVNEKEEDDEDEMGSDEEKDGGGDEDGEEAEENGVEEKEKDGDDSDDDEVDPDVTMNDD